MQQSDLDIRRRLSAARLSPMPQMLVQLMEHCQADDIGMAELANLIGTDAAMTAKILRVANSSAYRRQSRLVSLEQSLMTLGMDMVKTLCISESVFHIFDDLSHSNGAGLRGFWKHSLSAALTARLIAEKLDYPHIEEAYLAGLLHDVGRLAFLSVAPREYAFNFFARDDENLCAVEERTLQLTHSEAGAWMIEQWKLDSFLADSVLYHHEPMARLEKAHPLIRIVSLAHFLSGHEQNDAARELAGALCGLKGRDLDAITSSAAEQLGKTADYLGIDLAGADDAPALAAHIVPPAPPPTAKDLLNDKMRNMVLATEAGKSFAGQYDEAGLLEAITRSARMLFDFSDATILLADTTGKILAGAMTDSTATEHRARLAALSIPLSGGSVLAEAALQGRIVYIGHDGKPLSVVEEQLQRILGGESLVCLPLGTKERCLGALIGSAEPWQLADFRRREGFLQAFAMQAASALKSLPTGSTAIADNREQTFAAEYRAASRRVAHEVNNPLSIIKNYLRVLDRKLAKQEPVSGEMSILNEEIDRVGHMINGLADFQPSGPMAYAGITEVDRTVADVVRLFLNTGSVPASVQIIAQKHEQSFEIDGDTNTVKQILMNLIKNAVEALPAGGRIDIANNGLVNRDGGLFVELLVKDSGPGIPADVMARLFSPVQSTKGERHRGLGLSIVYGLVKKLKGHISCRSDKKGTAFEVLLPVPSHDQTPASRPQVKNSA